MNPAERAAAYSTNSRPFSSRRREALGIVALTAVVAAVFAIVAAPASAKSAEGLHTFQYSILPEEVGVGNPGEPHVSFWDPTGIAVDNSSGPEAGKLYVGAHGAGGTLRIFRFNPPTPTEATYDCLISGAGENSTEPRECAAEGPPVPDGEFHGMYGVAVDPSNGNFYGDQVAFFYNPATERYEQAREVNMFNSSGVLQKSLSLGEQHVYRIAAAPGLLYLANETTNAVEKWVPSTGTRSVFSTGAEEPTGRFGEVIGVSVDTDPTSASYNDVYVTDAGINEVQSYTPPAPEIEGQLSEYTLTFEGKTTKPLRGAASPSKVREELEELSTVTKFGEAKSVEATQSGNIRISRVGSEYHVEFIHQLGTTNVPQLEAELIEPRPPAPQAIPVTTVRQGIVPALDKLGENGEYLCQITGGGEDSTSASECSKSGAPIPGAISGTMLTPGRGFDSQGGIRGAVAVDPGNGHVYVEHGVSYTASSGGTQSPPGDYTHLYIDEFDSRGNFIAAIEESPEYQLAAYNMAISLSSHQIFLADLNEFEVHVFGGDKPKVQTDEATGVSGSSAVLQGTINTFNIPVEECKFEYVEASKWEPEASEPYAAGAVVPCEGTLATPEGEQPVEARISGLQSGKTYFYRLVGKNANGSSVGEDELFGAPYAGTYVATEVEQTSAKLNAAINPNDGVTTYYFEYGPDTSYGSKAPVSAAGPINGNKEQLIGETINGLQPGTEYHYRIVASNPAGTTYGRDRNLTTAPAVSIDPIAARHQTTNSAILQAYIDPLGSATTYHFEYGTSSAYGHSTPAASAGSGSETTLQEAQITGLQPGTEYHFRTVASNGVGSVNGPDVAFVTEAANCPNESRRKEQGKPAEMLPECRAYERVSPEEKGGAPADSGQLAANGQRVLYKSIGLFAGNKWSQTPLDGAPYLAHRTQAGWVTEAIHPTVAQVPLSQVNGLSGEPTFMSANLDETFWGGQGNNLSAFEQPTGTTFYQRNSSGEYSKVAPDLETIGSAWENSGFSIDGESLNLHHLVASVDAPMVPSDPYPAGGPRLYDITLGANPSSTVVNVNSAGGEIAHCGPAYEPIAMFAGSASNPLDPNAATNSITPDGSRIFFETVPKGPHEEDCHPEGRGFGINWQIYERIDQSQTVPISEPESNEECVTKRCRTATPQDALFDGASSDGSKVFFLDTAPLVDEGTEDTLPSDSAHGCNDNGAVGFNTGPNGCNLYMYDFNRPAGHNLVDISGGVPETTEGTQNRVAYGPEVKYILRSSPDGSHVYFIARGLLTDEPNGLGERAKQGFENLYYYNTETEQVRFIGDLCNGFEKSGAFADRRCSNNDYFNRTNEFTNATGTIFVFTTYSQITPDDKNRSTDVYRYDSETGAIERVSIGHNGEDDQNGNAGGAAKLMPASSCQGEPKAVCNLDSAIDERSVTADGSTIVFGSSRPLENGDKNEQEDFYEWHDGQVSLITGAASSVNIIRVGGLLAVFRNNPVISSDGRDIVFTTDASLVPDDQDNGLGDVYDARVEGGFKAQLGVSESCHGSETCAGHLEVAPATPAFGTETFSAPPEPHQCHKGFVPRHGHCIRREGSHHRRHSRRKHHKHGRQGSRPRGSARANHGGGK